MIKIESKKGSIVSVSNNLKNGEKIEDLSWASKSSVACFPATQNSKFRGNHVLFFTDLPSYSNMDIELIPLNENANFSLWGYQVAPNDEQLPPNLSSCVSCEADYKWDYPKRGKTQGHKRTIQFTAIKNSYKIVIGVVGGDEDVEGEFELVITSK